MQGKEAESSKQLLESVLFRYLPRHMYAPVDSGLIYVLCVPNSCMYVSTRVTTATKIICFTQH